MRPYCFVVLVPLAFAACRPANGLEGSVGETLSLKFDWVEIKKQDEFLLIEYLAVSTRATEKVCKLVMNTDGLDLPSKGAFELVDDLFLEHVELQRATVAADQFPVKESGEIKFDDLEFRAGGDVAGEFLITFEGEGSLSGWFSGVVDVST